MYIELGFLFLMYAFSAIALLTSIYALWTLKEVEEFYKKKNSRPKQQQYYNASVTQPKQVKKPTGHWG